MATYRVEEIVVENNDCPTTNNQQVIEPFTCEAFSVSELMQIGEKVKNGRELYFSYTPITVNN